MHDAFPAFEPSLESELDPATTRLDVECEAQTAGAILGHNFPDSPWYKDAYTLVSSDGKQPVENKKSWISRLFNG